MARDCIEVMKHYGHESFWVVAHDRGARVAHRLSLDHPEAVKKMILLDIAPTLVSGMRARCCALLTALFGSRCTRRCESSGTRLEPVADPRADGRALRGLLLPLVHAHPALRPSVSGEMLELPSRLLTACCSTERD